MKAHKAPETNDGLNDMIFFNNCVGDVRGIGLFTIIDLVKNRETREPLIPWNAGGADLTLNKEILTRLLDGGIFTFVRWNWIFVTSPGDHQSRTERRARRYR